jgi:hypothetical protein
MKTLIQFFCAGMLFATAASALADVHYVDVNGTNATPPFASWGTAAMDIQSAVDAALAGDEIVVTNGIYATGGRDGNRVKVDKPMSLRSVNGPQFTTIRGGYSVRCAYLTNGGSLSGFTLTGGAIFAVYPAVVGGAGVWCASSSAVVSNCVISGNQAWSSVDVAEGAGAYGGNLSNCTLSSNSAKVYVSLYHLGGDAYGGGACYCTLNNCTLSGNSAGGETGVGVYGFGGGAAYCTLNNCTLNGNAARGSDDNSSFSFGLGGGAYNCTLNNCTLSGNLVAGDYAYSGDPYDGLQFAEGGGAYNSTLSNCIFYFNTNWYYRDDAGGVDDYVGSIANHCWASPSNPLFVDYAGGNFRLQPNSPCINAGDNSYVTSATDLDGNPRLSGGTVDIGAYEYQWPQLTITPSDSNIVLTWPTNNLGYDYTGFTVQSTTNLISTVVWDTNSSAPVVVNGQNVVTNPTTGPQMFFRLIH